MTAEAAFIWARVLRTPIKTFWLAVFLGAAILAGLVDEAASADYSLQIGREVDYLQSSNARTTKAVYPWTVRAGYLQSPWAVAYEFLFDQRSKDGSDPVSIGVVRESHMIWARHALVPELAQRGLGVFAGVGAGVYRESVETNFYGVKSQEYGQWLSTGGMELGWWGFVYGPFNAEISFNGRFGEEFSPEFQWGLGTRLGLAF